jgi:hypothetical protein
MPAYEYENLATGERTVLFRPVALRNEAPEGFRRVPLPGRLAIVGSARPPCAEDEIREGWRKLEEREGSRFRRHLDWPAETVKRALDEPDPPTPPEIAAGYGPEIAVKESIGL